MHLVISLAFWVVIVVLAPIVSTVVQALPWIIAFAVLALLIRWIVRRHGPSSSGDIRSPTIDSNHGHTTSHSAVDSVFWSRSLSARPSEERRAPNEHPRGNHEGSPPRLRHDSSIHAPPTGTMINRGIIIRPDRLTLILSGAKLMELRKRHRRILGPVALIEKGTKRILGVASIVESVGPMNWEDFLQSQSAHAVESSRLRDVFEDGYRIGWRLDGVRSLDVPVLNRNPRGQGEVVLDAQTVEDLATQLGSRM